MELLSEVIEPRGVGSIIRSCFATNNSQGFVDQATWNVPAKKISARINLLQEV